MARSPFTPARRWRRRRWSPSPPRHHRAGRRAGATPRPTSSTSTTVRSPPARAPGTATAAMGSAHGDRRAVLHAGPGRRDLRGRGGRQRPHPRHRRRSTRSASTRRRRRTPPPDERAAGRRAVHGGPVDRDRPVDRQPLLVHVHLDPRPPPTPASRSSSVAAAAAWTFCVDNVSLIGPAAAAEQIVNGTFDSTARRRGGTPATSPRRWPTASCAPRCRPAATRGTPSSARTTSRCSTASRTRSASPPRPRRRHVGPGARPASDHRSPPRSTSTRR